MKALLGTAILLAPVRCGPTSCGRCCFGDVEAAKDSALGDRLDTSFYGKVLRIRDGFFVASSFAVDDDALYETALTVSKMTRDRPDFVEALEADEVHVAVIGKDEAFTDIPEYSDLNSADWDWARGGGPTSARPAVSCAEEDVLCLPGEAYWNENICVHEFAHAIQGHYLQTPRKIDAAVAADAGSNDLGDEIQRLYADQVEGKGLWDNTYAGTNHQEYFAEAVQAYYDIDAEGKKGGNGIHNHVNTRAELATYDAPMSGLLGRIFPADVSFPCPASACDCGKFDCSALRKNGTEVSETNAGSSWVSTTRFRLLPCLLLLYFF